MAADARGVAHFPTFHLTRFCFPACVLKVGQARQVPELPIEPKKGILNMHAYQKGSSKLEFRNHWDNTLLNYRPANPPTNRSVMNSRSRLFGFLAGEGRGEGGAGGNGDGVEQGKENNMSKLPINRPKAAFRILF